MRNELLLLLTVLLFYGGVLFFYRLLGTTGLYCWTVLATIAANIEVMLMVEAFGLEQTLGNVLFASTFLVTDILSENEGEEAANRAVLTGILTSVCFIVISQIWLLYTPAASDWAMPAIREIFTNTPRLMAASLIVYAICQRFDVWAYHAWWHFTEARFGNRRRFLWLRNNGSTLISQLLNTVLYTLGAFLGVYSAGTLISVMISSYVIFIFTSLLDTPAVYLARRMDGGGE